MGHWHDIENLAGSLHIKRKGGRDNSHQTKHSEATAMTDPSLQNFVWRQSLQSAAPATIPDCRHNPEGSEVHVLALIRNGMANFKACSTTSSSPFLLHLQFNGQIDPCETSEEPFRLFIIIVPL